MGFYLTTLEPDSSSQKMQFPAPLASQGPRTEWNTDPDVMGPWDGEALRRPPGQSRQVMLGGGTQDTDPGKTDEGPLPLLGGARKGFTDEVMGTTALNGLHEERKQLGQNLPSVPVSEELLTLRCQSQILCLPSASDWELLEGDLPSRAKFNQSQPQEEEREEDK